LKTKYKLFNKFQEFKTEIENLKRKKIKTFITNNGGEYTCKELASFCKSTWIRREITIPHNPQQNDVAKRKNRSIKEIMKTLMNYQGLSMHLWGEVAMTTIYVQNKSSHHILKDMAP
jgi:transposase InsO family protein